MVYTEDEDAKAGGHSICLFFDHVLGSRTTRTYNTAEKKHQADRGQSATKGRYVCVEQ